MSSDSALTRFSTDYIACHTHLLFSFHSNLMPALATHISLMWCRIRDCIVTVRLPLIASMEMNRDFEIEGCPTLCLPATANRKAAAKSRNKQ